MALVGIVIVAHGGLAEALLAATEHVVGPQPQTATVTIHPADDLSARQAEIAARVREVDGGEGVVVITDMFGGTPSNLALGCLGTRVEVICGANLPLLVKLAKSRDRPLAEAVAAGIDAGHKYLASATSLLDPGRAR